VVVFVIHSRLHHGTISLHFPLAVCSCCWGVGWKAPHIRMAQGCTPSAQLPNHCVGFETCIGVLAGEKRGARPSVSTCMESALHTARAKHPECFNLNQVQPL
jgi:hypothetical protein